METISNYFPRLYLQSLEKQGVDPEGVISKLGLDRSINESSLVRISIDTHVKITRAVLRILRDESFGYLSSPIKIGTCALAYEFAFGAETIGEAIEKIVRYTNLTVNDFRLSLTIEGGYAKLQFKLLNDEVDEDSFIVMSILSRIHRYSNWLSGKSIPLHFLSMGFDEPPASSEFQYIFPCPYEQGNHNISNLYFDASCLHYPVIRNKSEFPAFLKNGPVHLLSRLYNNASIVSNVYGILADSRFTTLPSSKTVADKLNITDQTLRRRLKQEQTSYQKIKDDFRRDIAIYQLRKSTLTVAQVSERLGFSSPGSFSRAFKQWTGSPPDIYRKQ